MTHRPLSNVVAHALVLAALASGSLHAQGASPRADAAVLHREIAAADSSMFAAYNDHDADRLGRWFARDLEFYHDTGGLLGWDASIGGLRSVFTQSPDIRRALVGPIEVYPIRDYGAIEVGEHRFCHREQGRDVCGTFKFTHVWKKTADGWIVTRVVSYGH